MGEDGNKMNQPILGFCEDGGDFLHGHQQKNTVFFGLALPPMNILIKLCEVFLYEDCCLHACLKLFDDKNIRFQSYPATFQIQLRFGSLNHLSHHL